MFRSLRARLTLSFVGIVAATTIALGLSLSLIFAHALQDQYQTTFDGNARGTYALMESGIRPTVQDAGLAGLTQMWQSGQLQRLVTLFSTPFRFRIQIYETPLGYDKVIVADSGQEKADSARHLAVDHFPAYAQPLIIDSANRQLAQLVISEPLTDRAYKQQQFEQTVLWVGLGACLLALIIGGALAERLTAPLRILTRATARLGAQNLSERVPEGRRDETGELAHQFNRMAARLEESFATISADRDLLRQFVADVSHELRTPLTALRTFNDLLQDGAGDDAATRRDFLGESARQIERLDWLTHNLLDLSRLDAGITRPALRQADLAETLRRAVETNRPIAEGRGVRLDYDAHPLFVAHDPARLEQALSNIAGNAVKFSPSGGSVRARAYAGDGTAVVEITDEGPGIPPEEAEHIFERFYRGRDANRAGEGSGLGLAIAKAIVEAHGGAIAVTSTPGHGATFRLTLPLTPHSQQSIAPATPHQAMTS